MKNELISKMDQMFVGGVFTFGDSIGKIVLDMSSDCPWHTQMVVKKSDSGYQVAIKNNVLPKTHYSVLPAVYGDISDAVTFIKTVIEGSSLIDNS